MRKPGLRKSSRFSLRNDYLKDQQAVLLLLTEFIQSVIEHGNGVYPFFVTLYKNLADYLHIFIENKYAGVRYAVVLVTGLVVFIQDPQRLHAYGVNIRKEGELDTAFANELVLQGGLVISQPNYTKAGGVKAFKL